MADTFIQGSGNKIKFYAAVLPLGDRTPPEDVTGITNTAEVGVDDTTISIATPLTSPIGAGTALVFVNAGNNYTVFLTEDGLLNATQLVIEPNRVVIPISSTADYIARTRVSAGTNLNYLNNNNRTTTVVFEDDQGYEEGVVTTANWQMDWTGNFLPGNLGFNRVEYANRNAVKGREAYVWFEDAPPIGYDIGDITEGASTVENLNNQRPANGILTYTCTFQGQGTPTRTRHRMNS